MTASTLIHREVGDELHILNFTLGEIMSFEREDGHFLLNNLDQLEHVDTTPDDIVLRFLTTRENGISSRTFRSDLVNLGMAFNFPTIANLEINRRCVLRCEHCYIPLADRISRDDSEFEGRDEVQTATLLDSLRQLGVFFVVLTGGEVFVNRKFRTLLGQLRDRDFVVEIFSSLQLLPKWFVDIDPVEWRIGRIQTSVYSVTSPIHDQVTGTVGSMKRTLENLEVLHNKGFYVEVATPLMKSNFHDRNDIERYFAERGIKQSFAWPIVSEYYNGNENKSFLNVTREQFLEFCGERPDYLIQLDTERNPEAPICPAGRAVFSISANGDVFSCSQFPKVVGNINDSDAAKIYHSPGMHEIANHKISEIPERALTYNYCMGNNYSETGNPLQQDPVLYDLLGRYEISRKAEIAKNRSEFGSPGFVAGDLASFNVNPEAKGVIR